MTAVKRCCFAIDYIHNPSEEIQLEAIKQNNRTIQFIHTPAPSVVRYIIENCDDLDIIQSMRIDFDELPVDLKLLLEIRF